MNFFSKLVIVIICVFALIFIKDTFFANKNNEIITKLKKIEKIQPTKKNVEKKDSVEKPQPAQQKNKKIINIYFTNANDGELRILQKELPQGKAKMNFALETILAGPTLKETSLGYSSEIPKGARLLRLKDSGNAYIIDISDDFQYGGGTESQYLRLKQFIKTIIDLKPDKPVYLYLNGKKAEVIGGEGIQITQPISENSLHE